MSKKGKARKGLTSVVIMLFVVLIFGVIAVSFSRLMMSEALQTTNNDLSQSAYDSALAGLEDAKTALLKYHACLDDYGTVGNAPQDCQKIINEMQNGIRNNDCDTVARALGRLVSDPANGGYSEGVIIQETQSASANGNSADMLQAYTCVTIEEELSDYRTTLNADNAIRLVPIRVHSEDVNNISYIEVNWFSRDNEQNLGYTHYASGLPSLGGYYLAPSVLGVGLIQTDPTFSLSELSMANDETAAGSAHRTDRAQIYLKPEYRNSAEITTISADDFASTANGAITDTYGVYCNKQNLDRTGFYCSARIGLPKTFKDQGRNAGSFMVLLSLPYTVPETDVSLMVFEGNPPNWSNPVPLRGVQARVDSTGRANDLYRRLEARIELVDTFFPYPQYEIQMSSGASDIRKTFYSTWNCWSTYITGTNHDGFKKQTCSNYSEQDNLSEW